MVIAIETFSEYSWFILNSECVHQWTAKRMFDRAKTSI